MNFLERLFPSRFSDPKQLLANDVVQQVNSLMRSLVNLRKQKKYTQAEVAEELGISREGVAQFERHDSNPTLNTIKRYALAIDARIDIRVTDGAFWAEGMARKKAILRYQETMSRLRDHENVIDLNLRRALREITNETPDAEVS